MDEVRSRRVPISRWLRCNWTFTVFGCIFSHFYSFEQHLSLWSPSSASVPLGSLSVDWSYFPSSTSEIKGVLQ
ncbi:hypothetical protein K503DRAFT_772434 [Rhizopogon vinicolor AM-OR11-026]|uniref:Uncharacterized protein n=1 Tax=Rhizopogon vinicolor AM-OR11-026 TaxID=1314800 RepID=A0A1B7MVD1_9AGAM|nr:hypothetical protein K503DRAFT_772434 [Rhizopogon vinicolor AM-OR11-026]